MRRRGRGAGLRPVAAQVCARSMPGTSEVHRRSMAVSSLASGLRMGVTTGELDVAGLSWTSWDMIEKVHRADQGRSGTADATRTERGFQVSRNVIPAGQWLFRWVG